LFSGSAPIEEWKDLQWSLLGFGPEGEEFLSKEGIPEELSSLVEELDSETRRAVKEIDRYASASALAQERAGLMGRADDLRMDLRDMQEQIREMDAAQAGLRSAFQEAYRRPEEALRAWDRLVGETRRFGNSGIEKASQILAASPERLGRLRGASAFGFSTPARSVSIRSVARAAGLARAYQDAARRATRLGAFAEEGVAGEDGENAPKQGVLEKGRSVEKKANRYPGFSKKRGEIEATLSEASALGKKVKELTGGRPISEQKRAVTETVRSLGPKQRQALRTVILGAGEQPVGREQAGRGMASRATPRAVPGRDALEKKPVARRNATARSTTSRGQPASKATSKASAMKGLLKASLRHVAIHVAIRTLDRVEKEARGREMLEI
jgi:hypothetical protein